MKTRREFMQCTAVAAGAVVLAPLAAKARDFSMDKGILYNAKQAGMWRDVVKLHVPVVDVKGLDVVVTTPHSMSKEHYIVRHTIVDEMGNVAHAKTFMPTDTPISKAMLKKKGKYVATSFCNLHDMWVKEFTV